MYCENTEDEAGGDGSRDGTASSGGIPHPRRTVVSSLGCDHLGGSLMGIGRASKPKLKEKRKMRSNMSGMTWMAYKIRGRL